MARVKSPIVKLRYRHYLNQDYKTILKAEKSNVEKVSYTRTFKDFKYRTIRNMFKFVTLKILYPMHYKKAAKKPVDDKKVLFAVPRYDTLPNSLSLIYDRINESGDYNIKVHYLTKLSLRLKQQYQVTDAFIRDLATAKYLFIDEANPDIAFIKKRPETQVVQLWHGCGAFKKFGFSTADKIFGNDAKTQQKYPMYANYSLVTVSSPEVVWAYEEAMMLEGMNIVKPLGNSRTDVFYDEAFIAAAKERVLEACPQARGKKIILYAPTFRGRVSNAQGPDRLDYDRLYEELGDEYVIIIKHHPLVVKLPDIPDRYNGSFVFDVSRTGDISDLICAADICISDYSSLVFEYSLLERPLIFFAYDLDTYFDWRGFYYDYYEMAPGPVVSSTEGIIDYIKNLDTRFDRKRLQDFRYKFMRSCDGHATERIFKEIGLTIR
ncbi:MAG: CDP-glycerol glycerophosphotransferase family protein [Eubacterium sp.]|nr:CDP-glycerol glycerophosphotransferase family protein [Eubacterium sp.]